MNKERQGLIGVCPQCGNQIEIGSLVGAKLGGAAVGALVGGCASEHWLGVIVGAAVGGAIGHVIDEEVLPSCPICRVALEVLNVMI